MNELTFRPITAADETDFYTMAEEFYHSDAVLHPIPAEYHRRAFAEMMRSGQYLSGYIFTDGDNTAGFAVTNRELLSLTEAPRRLVVIGGGVIGLEMAAYFNSIGSEITVIEMLDHIAGENDRELVGILQKHYEKRGMKLLLSAKVTEIADGAVRYEKDGKSCAVECDKALISIGRRPNIKDVGLESIGVLTERGAIVTDSRMRTNQPEVYAAGDVNGRSMLAHTAYREAEVAVNTMLGKRDNMRYDAIPAVLYTNPELSGVGYTDAAAAAWTPARSRCPCAIRGGMWRKTRAEMAYSSWW